MDGSYSMKVERNGRNGRLIAAYLKLISGVRIARTVPIDSDENVMIDLDEKGQLIGIELLPPVGAGEVGGYIVKLQARIEKKLPKVRIPVHAYKELERIFQPA